MKATVVYIFDPEYKEVLMVLKAYGPYPGKWCGLGGKIEPGETETQSAIRECKEETEGKIVLENPKLLKTEIHPDDGVGRNSGLHLSVFYATHPKVEITSNREGIYVWQSLKFALNFNSRAHAGFADNALFIREILNKEGIQDFYKQKPESPSWVREYLH